MAITRFALNTPAANTDTSIHTVTREALVSVIATNKATTAATVRIWVQPLGSTGPSEYVYQSYDVVIPANNSMETFRFAVEKDDVIYVRSSSANICFSVNGVYEENGRQYVYLTSTEPSAATTGDIWIDDSTDTIAYWDGSQWVGSSTEFSTNYMSNLASSTVSITTNTANVISSYSTATYSSAEFLIQLKQGTSYRTCKVIMLSDGTSVSHTEYGILSFGTTIPVTFTTSISSGTAQLNATITNAATTNVTAKIVRMTVTA